MKKLWLFLFLGLIIPALMAWELQITKNPPNKEDLRTSPYLFTLSDGNEKFTYWHDSIDEQPQLLTPHHNLFAYFHRNRLFVVDGPKKQIVFREILPEKIKAVEWQGDDSLAVTMAWEGGGPSTIAISLTTPNRLPGSSYFLSYRSEFHDISHQMNKMGLALPDPKKESRQEPHRSGSEVPTVPRSDTPPASSKEPSKPAEQIAFRLTELAQLDATNPWVEFFQGLLLWKSGRSEQARQLWQEMPKWPKTRWYHLTRMGIELHHLQESSLAKSFHTAAMTRIYQTGFQPSMNLYLIDLMLHKGGLAPHIQKLREQQRWQEASALLEEYYEFAPRCEAFCGVMLHFAQELTQAGQAALAAQWQERAQEAMPFQSLASPVISDLWLGINITMLIAMLAACFLYPLIMLAKTPVLSSLLAGTNKEERRKSRLLSRPALISILILVTATIACGWMVTGGISAIMRSASMPLAILSHMNHPRTIEWVNRSDDSQAKHFYNGLIRQFQKQFDQARTEYEQAPDFPQSHHNLALIDQAQGQDPSAQFQAALQIDPTFPETLWAKQKQITAPRVAVYQKYCPELPMIATASGQIHGQLLVPSLYHWPDFPTFFTAKEAGIALLLLGIVILFTLVSIFRPAPEIPHGKTPSWWLAALLPGSSKYWFVGGSIVSAIWFAALFLIVLNHNNTVIPFPMFSIFEAMAIPNFTSIFGIPSQAPDLALRRFLLSGAFYIVVLLPIINLAMLTCEWKRLGAVKKEEATQPTQ